MVGAAALWGESYGSNVLDSLIEGERVVHTGIWITEHDDTSHCYRVSHRPHRGRAWAYGNDTAPFPYHRA